MDPSKKPGRLRIKQIARIKSVDVKVPVRRIGVASELRLRIVTTPANVTAHLLSCLGLRLPKGARKSAMWYRRTP
jgi:hypothetical protein